MSESCLNVFHRKKFLSDLSSQKVELLIIGGGITGAGIALDAASRGIQVALVEKSDFSSGTSSKSTKLIHGGLRYLKEFQFSIVRETGKERTTAYNNAPHLVHPEKLILPIVKNGTLGWRSTSFALWIYDLLAGVSKKDRKKMVQKKEVLELIPQFNKHNLVGAGIYSEYRSDDSRLTIEILKKAVSLGALVFNYIEAKEFIYDNGKVSGLVVKDNIENKEHCISSQCIVNAAGPWVDEIRQINKSLGKKRLKLSKGVHLVIKNNKLNLKHSVYFEADDKRMIFAIPREGKIYFGTTDTLYSSSIDNPKTSKQDAIYLLKCMNNAFEGINLELSDVISSWVGLRPLIHEQGKSSSEISRKDEIFISKSDLISIAGGKLTAYRTMAKRVVDLVNKKMKFTANKCQTKKLKLIKLKDELNVFKSIENQLINKYNLDENYAYYLWTRYGLDSKLIINKNPKYSNPFISIIINEFDYCLKNESVLHLLDFLRFHNARVYFYPQSISEFINPLADYAKEKLNWTEEEKLKEINSVNKFLKEAITFE